MPLSNGLAYAKAPRWNRPGHVSGPLPAASRGYQEDIESSANVQPVNQSAEFLARLEEGNSLRWHFDLGSRAWIASDAPSSLARVEASESADFNLVPVFQILWTLYYERIPGQNTRHNGDVCAAIKSQRYRAPLELAIFHQEYIGSA